LPGVQAAGLADLVPVDLHIGRSSVFIEGRLLERTATAPRAMNSRISPGYFQAMSTRLLRGREFTDQDDEKNTRVVIINEAFARRFWPGEEPIGKRFSVGGPEEPKLQVVGVAQDGKYAGLNEDHSPFFYRPLFQSRVGGASLIVRADIEPQKALAAIRGELQRLDPHLPIAGARTLSEHLSFPLLPARVAASLLGSFGLLALILAAVGIYGVMSYAVLQRIREIGIRMALGARRSDVMRMVIGQGMTLALIGVALGLLASVGLTRLMKNLLFGVSATDPPTFALIVILLTCVALLACWIPARRATKVDPMTALRRE
jgi:putative ABC transport system permease protein